MRFDFLVLLVMDRIGVSSGHSAFGAAGGNMSAVDTVCVANADEAIAIIQSHKKAQAASSL
jgi:hypothetical protein